MSAADLCLALALSALLSVVVAAAQYMRAEKAEAEVARLTAERDALAAQVAEGVHVTEVWVSDLATDAMVHVMDGAALESINEQLKRLLDLRAALADSEADTSDTQPTDQEEQ